MSVEYKICLNESLMSKGIELVMIGLSQMKK